MYSSTLPVIESICHATPTRKRKNPLKKKIRDTKIQMVQGNTHVNPHIHATLNTHSSNAQLLALHLFLLSYGCTIKNNRASIDLTLCPCMFILLSF